MNSANSVLATGFACFFLLGGCTRQKSTIGQEVLVQVNDHSLTAQEFSDRMARQLKAFDALAAKDPNTVSRVKDDVFRTYMFEALIVDYARAAGLMVSDTELDKEVNDTRSQYPDDVSFRKVLAEENLSVQSWRESLRITLLQRKVFKSITEKLPVPTADEIQRYYTENKDKYKRKERLYLRQIVTDDLTKATELRDEVKKKDFMKLATQFSVAPEGKNGGLIGWIEKGSVDIFDKAFLLPLGGISQVLESPYGFHIIKVEKKSPAGHLPLEDVKSLIRQDLMAQKEQAEFSGWLDRQLRSSRVMKNQELIRNIRVETRKENE